MTQEPNGLGSRRPPFRRRGAIPLLLLLSVIATSIYQVHIYNTRKKADFLRERIVLLRALLFCLRLSDLLLLG